jgi:hypothetical protein
MIYEIYIYITVTAMKVAPVDISIFKAFDKKYGKGPKGRELLQNLYGMAADQAVKLTSDGVIGSMKERLTLYSLYKQTEEGDIKIKKPET